MIEVQKITKEDYPGGKKALFTYESDKYYDVIVGPGGVFDISLVLKDFPGVFKKSMEVDIFEDHKENLEVYIAKAGNREIGLISFSHQSWNNTLRVWDLYIDKEFRGKGTGKRLMEIAISCAKERLIRAVVIETQTSNYNAISFYTRSGFKITGIDIINYSNTDIDQKEVRIEMSRLIAE